MSLDNLLYKNKKIKEMMLLEVVLKTETDVELIYEYASRKQLVKLFTWKDYKKLYSPLN